MAAAVLHSAKCSINHARITMSSAQVQPVIWISAFCAAIRSASAPRELRARPLGRTPVSTCSAHWIRHKWRQPELPPDEFSYLTVVLIETDARCLPVAPVPLSIFLHSNHLQLQCSAKSLDNWIRNLNRKSNLGWFDSNDFKSINRRWWFIIHKS